MLRRDLSVSLIENIGQNEMKKRKRQQIKVCRTFRQSFFKPIPNGIRPIIISTKTRIYGSNRRLCKKSKNICEFVVRFWRKKPLTGEVTNLKG